MTTAPNDIAQTLGLNRPKRHPLRRLTAYLALFALLGAGFWLFLADGSGNPQGPQFRTQAVKQGDLAVTVTATGTLQPRNSVEVGSELSGTITEVAVDFNDRVTPGQLLARLDTELLEAKLTAARASLQLAEARVDEASATVQETRAAERRCADLAKQKMCSTNDLDAAKAALARAHANEAMTRAQLAMAQAELAQQETNLAKATIRAPIGGVVLDRKVEPGQTVAASLQTPELFTLAEDLAKMELLVAVDEADIGQIREGMRATFSVDAYPERPFSAQVTQIRHAPEEVDGVVTYKTVLLVENPDLALLPGMTATAEIHAIELSGATLIPNAALRFTPPTTDSARSGNLLTRLLPRPPAQPKRQGGAQENGTKRVWTLQEGQPTPVAVKLGVSDGQWSQLLEGQLAPGSELLVETLENKR